ncbi:MAG: KEOPS complex subunit Cgi121 [Candidatus Bathyarchaeota archaeon]|nr:KEOPS complex subunit Cgi121 [Candidatus Bathyarchaeota archaeon]
MVTAQRITDTDWYIAVAGVRDASIISVDRTLEEIRDIAGDAIFQLFDAEKVAGSRHLIHAAINAVKALETGAAVSKSLDVETLLYASCHDQISKAFQVMGLKDGVMSVAVIVLAKKMGEVIEKAEQIAEKLGDMDDSVLELFPLKYEALKKAYEVTEEAITIMGTEPYDSLTSLIIEKGSLLPLRK